MRKWYNLKRAGERSAELFIYNDIGYFGISAADMVSELNGLGELDQIDVRINSYGGEVFDALAIYNALKRNPANVTVHIDGVAASAAADIAMAGDEIRIASNAFLMIHNAWSIAIGEADDMRKEADFLDKINSVLADIYTARNGDREQVVEWLNAETWFTAREAIDAKFADSLDDEEGEQQDDPKNKFRQYVMNKAGARPRPADRIKALGLDDLLSPANAATPKEQPMTVEQFNEFAAKNPDAVKNVAKDLISQAREAGKIEGAEAAKPKNATASELKAAFPDDRDFVMDRLDVDAPMNEHKIAYAEYLKAKNKALADEVQNLKGELAKLDPGTAGRSEPLNTGDPDTGSEKPITPERKRQLLNLAGMSA